MAKTYLIKNEEETTISVGLNLMDDLDLLLKPYDHSAYFVVCDETTKGLFGKTLVGSLSLLNVPVHEAVIDTGEKSKSIHALTSLLEEMSELSLDKKAAVVALGGGVVGDVATVVAGLYFRGIDCIQIPTTLLSQVDSAIGGKGAINIGKHKNTVGLTRQPRHIIVDYSLLQSLPEEEIKSGMGEVIKYAIAMDTKLFAILEKQDPHALPSIDVIKRCIELKIEHVKKDPHDANGTRALLNFGHTVGHAIELSSDLPHGHAVSIGIAFTLKLSHALKQVAQDEVERSLMLLHKFHLPTTVKGIKKREILELIKKDKKAVHGLPRFVLLKKIGQVSLGQAGQELVEEALETILL